MVTVQFSINAIHAAFTGITEGCYNVRRVRVIVKAMQKHVDTYHDGGEAARLNALIDSYVAMIESYTAPAYYIDGVLFADGIPNCHPMAIIQITGTDEAAPARVWISTGEIYSIDMT